MKARRRHHLHLPGVLYVGMTLLMGLGAINSQNNLLFLAFGLALGSILIAGAISGWMLLCVDITRLPMQPGRVDEPMTIAYQLHNRSRWMPVFGLVIEETVGGRDSTWRQFFSPIRTTLASISTRCSRHAAATIRPTARGVVRFDRVRVWTTFPFGVFKKSVTFERPAETLLRPRRVDIAPSVLDQVMANSGVTERVSPRIGLDAEFYGLREYTPGDSMKRIAWRATARTGDLIVRESYAAVSADVAIALSFAIPDATADDAPDDQDEEAISVAASLIEAAVRRGARAILLAPIASLRIECRSAPGSAGVADEALDALASLDLAATPDLRLPRPIDEDAAAILVIHSHVVDPSVALPGATHLTARRAMADAHAASVNRTFHREAVR